MWFFSELLITATILIVCACSGGSGGGPDLSKSAQMAADIGCKLNPTPAKTINRCATPRKHGGEIYPEDVTIDDSKFSVWGAPQTYEHLYLYDCTNSCGRHVTAVGDVSWDCVGPQEMAAYGIDLAEHETDDDPCASPDKDLSDAFREFVKERYDNGNSHPNDMPAPAAGINYWQGD